MNIVCMKWGTAYGPDYVIRLHAMVQRHAPHGVRFVCFTDDPTGIPDAIETQPLPEVKIPDLKDMAHGSDVKRNIWRKVGLYRDDLGGLEGLTLYLDLDLVIVDDLTPFFEHEGAFCIIENWTQRGRGIGNSSVVRFRIGEQGHIVRAMEDDPERVARAFYGEQHFVSKTARGLTFWPDTWCRSFKFHCMPPRALEWAMPPKKPDDARIIVFHGTPKPEHAIAGHWPKRGRFVRKTPWLADHWG